MAEGGTLKIGVKVEDQTKQGLKDVKKSIDDVAKSLESAADGAKGVDENLESAEKAAKDLKQTDKNNKWDGLTNGSKKAQNLAKKLRTAGTAITAISGAATAAGIALARVALKKGWARLSSIDTATAKLYALGKSADEVAKINQSAMDSVSGTAFGYSDAVTVAATATAAGIKSGDDLTRYLTSVADTAAVAGTDLSSMGDIFNKVATKGKASSRELMQLANQGIPIYQFLADTMGVTAEQVSELAADGEISLSVFRKAIESNLGDAAKTMGTLSLKATIDNIGASLGRMGANILNADGDGAFSTLKGAADDLLQRLKNLEANTKEWGEVLGEKVANGYEKVMKLVDWFTDLSPAAKKATAGFLLFGAASGPVMIKTATLIEKMGTLNKALRRTGSDADSASRGLGKLKGGAGILSKLTSPAGIAAVSVAALAAAVMLVVKHQQKMKEQQEKVIKSTTGLNDATAKVVGSFREEGSSLDKVSDKASGAAKSYEEILEAQSQLADTINDRNRDASAQINLLDDASKTIEKYVGNTDLSAAAQGELETALMAVNDALGLNLTAQDIQNGYYQDEEGNIQNVCSSIDALIEKKKEQIQQEVLLDNYKDLYKQQYDDMVALSAAQAELAEAERLRNEYLSNGGNVGDQGYIGFESNVQSAQEKVSGLASELDSTNTAIRNVETQMGALGSASDGAASSFDKLIGSTEVSAAFEATGANLEQFAEDVKACGIPVEEFASLSSQQLLTLASQYDGTVQSIVSSMSAFGSGVTDGLTSGLQSGASEVGTAADEVGEQTKKADKSGEGAKWGFDLTSNIAEGLRSGISEVAKAAAEVAEAESAPLHQSTADIGPLRYTDEWGVDLVQNIITGMQAQENNLQRQVAKVASILNLDTTGQATIGATLSSDINWNSTASNLTAQALSPVVSAAPSTQTSVIAEQAGSSDTVYNIYINKARVNDDEQIQKVMNDFLLTTKRKVGMA